MSERMFDLAAKFFGELQNSSEAQQELKRYDRVVAFQLVDDESFSLDIRDGKVIVKEGLPKPAVGDAAMHFVTDRDVLVRLFKGKTTFTQVADKTKDWAPGDPKGKLYVRWLPGVGYMLVSWIGKLFRMGQELR